MKHETYRKAQIRLLGSLAQAGWHVKSMLKIPQAKAPDGRFTLFFKAQAVYMNEHSMFIDIRGMSFAEFIKECNETFKRRTGITLAPLLDW